MPLRLEDVAVPLPHDASNNFLGFKVQCHQATLIWLYHATYGHLPAKLDDILAKMTGTAAVMARMARRGVQLRAEYRLGVPLVPGSVLTFEKDGEVKHSCVVKTTTTIAGYNQMQWFREDGSRTKGISSSYSIHQKVDINWVQPFPSSTVNGSGYICRLMMVPLAAAIEEFQR